MSLLFRGGMPRSEKRSTINLSPYVQLVGALNGTTSTITVDADSAMRHDAVWACRTRIAQDVSMMPVDVVRYANGRRIEVAPTPQIIAAPSVFAQPIDWRYQVVDSWLGWGNAWGIVTQTTASGAYPMRIELQAPGSVTWFDTGEGPRFFVNNVEHEMWPVGDLWHEPAYTTPGSMIGLSPIAYHATTIGAGLGAEKFSADFFADGGHPSAILSVEGQAPNEEQAKKLKERFLSLTRGNREPIVLPSSTKYQPVQVNPQESQFLEAMQYSSEQVCRIYGEDPADYGVSTSGSSITYANRSDADLARFKRRQFWVVKLQDALTRMLPRPQVVRLNTSSALMMTAVERHELHALRLKYKTTTVNNVRLLEDEEPFDGVDAVNPYDNPGVPDGAPADPAPAQQGGAA